MRVSELRRGFLSCGEWGLLSSPPTGAASAFLAPRLSCHRQVGSSQARDGTCAPCVSEWTQPLDPQEVPRSPVSKSLLKSAARGRILKHQPAGACFCPKPCHSPSHSHPPCGSGFPPPVSPAYLPTASLVCTLAIPALAPLN